MTAVKVVRVEDVLQGPQDTEVTSLQVLAKKETNGKSELSSFNKDNYENSNGQEEEEARDEMFPLPSNWPWIEQLSRPMSCSLTKSRLPCVRRAISHLELIQNIVDEWFKNREEAIASCLSQQELSVSSQGIPKKQLRFVDPVTRCTTTESIVMATSTTSSRVSSPLSIIGVGATVSELEETDSHNIVESSSGNLNIPHLGSNDVIEEVITLMARLETDRQETQQHYLKEIKTVMTLKAKIDDLCLRRLRDLPLLVQREHETCIMDLNELHWHVAYISRTEARSQKRKQAAADLHDRLKEDISFVKQHVPLVQEKLVLEVQAMDKIKKAQAETNQELMATQQRQAKTEQKSKEALSKAETERGHIKRELDTVRDKLKQISEDLTRSKTTFSKYTKQVTSILQQLDKNTEELQTLEVKETNAKAAEEMQGSKVRALQGKIADAEFEFRRLENDNTQAEDELAILRTKNTARISELDRRSRVLQSKLLTAQRKNQELSIDIEDTQEKITACERRKVADEKNIARINKEIERVGVMMQSITSEHAQVSAINSHVRSKLTSEQEKSSRAEESLKNTVDSLRRQVKEEVHARTVLQARIASDTLEIEKGKTESAKKREKAGKVSDDVDTAISTVLEKVERLRSLKITKEQKVAELQTKVAETHKQHQESLKLFQERLAKLSPQRDSLKGEVGQLDKQLDYMAWKTTLMNKKIEEMGGAQVMMERACKKTEAAIDELKEELAEATLQLETAHKIRNSLKGQYQNVLDRLRDGENQHARLIGDRKMAFHNHEDEKNKCLSKNKDLAARYRKLMNEFLVMKEKLLRDFDERINLETTITDIKQLKSLQSKLHGALAEYFKLSGLYHEGELTRLEQQSAENSQRVGRLQEDMDSALRLITHFLSTQMDGPRAHQTALAPVPKVSEVNVGQAGAQSTGAGVFAA